MENNNRDNSFVTKVERKSNVTKVTKSNEELNNYRMSYDNSGRDNGPINAFSPVSTDSYGQENFGNVSGFTLWLVLGFLEIILCCSSCFTAICGIISVIFVLLANDAFKNGYTEKADEHMKVAKVLIIIGGAFLVLRIVLKILKPQKSIFMKLMDKIFK